MRSNTRDSAGDVHYNGAMSTPRCHHCGADLVIAEPIPRDAECDACRRDVRCCLNCRHHDAAYNNECRETMADPVADKGRRNFCEYFALARNAGGWPRDEATRAADARAKLEALFKKPKPDGPDDDLRSL